MFGPPSSSASDSGVSMAAVKPPTWVFCIPGATIQPSELWLPCDVGVSLAKIPGTVVSLYPGGGRSRSSL
ncbi:hypothetical protein C1Y40_03782 [Mycobacterium talmoniae]|uniref:Uncharacterized protein n=1 Tax=Mycobacterium talmoniae TaxID=1858794 RepID=A0A2S8BH81_9MYCO|nr:hypothetical protein C1Y40_03782 [Mycobacterium talmoniae]